MDAVNEFIDCIMDHKPKKEHGMKKVFEILKQKSTLTGIGAVCTGIGLIIADKQAEGIQTIIGGLGLIFLRQAVAKK
jgi:hypothetical protein